MAASRYHRVTRAEWASLRADTPLTLTETDPPVCGDSMSVSPW